MDDTQRAILASVAIGAPVSGAITWAATVSTHPSNGLVLRIVPPTALAVVALLMLAAALRGPKRRLLNKAIRDAKEALAEMDLLQLAIWHDKDWEPAQRAVVLDNYGVSAGKRFVTALFDALRNGHNMQGMMLAQVRVLEDLKRGRWQRRYHAWRAKRQAARSRGEATDQAKEPSA